MTGFIVLWLALVMMLGCGGGQSRPALNAYFPSRNTEVQPTKPAHECEVGEYLIGRTPYKCDPKTFTWVEDTAAEEQERKDAQHRFQLANDLISKCVSVKEMKEIANLGDYLYVINNTPYTPSDVQAKYSAALQVQHILCDREGRP